MRRVYLALIPLLTACPPSKSPPLPEPSGRCEVDLAALGHFASVGNGASASTIDDEAQLIGGGFAQGRVGDFLLENDRIRVVIQQAGRAIHPIPYGGTIIDADIKRSTGSGRDEFGKMGLIYAFGRTANHTKVEVLNDGQKGGYAVVAATGEDAVIDYVNVKSVLGRFLGDVQLVRDPNTPIPLTITTYYVLSPGENRVRVLSAFCNGGKESVVMQVGDLVDQGGLSDIFNPQGCTNGMGAEECLVDPSPWFGYQAEEVAYGYRAYKFAEPKTPAVNAMLYVAGVAAVLAEGEDQAGVLSWVDPMASQRPGTFGMLAGARRTFLRDFFVGKDLAEISGTMLALDAAPKARLNVTVQNADGSAAPGARISVKAAESGRMQTMMVADAEGLARANLSPGNYLIGSAAVGTALEPMTAVTVPSSGEVSETLKRGASRMLSVQVADPFHQPMPAKVVVRCTNPPCSPQLADYHLWFDIEDQPSDIRAIAFAGADGRVDIPLPPAQYEVLVSRGMEYSAFPDSFPVRGEVVDLRSGNQTVSATLAHVIDSTGWLNADLHVHAMASADSSVGNAMRAMNFAAEGVEVLVSTDHDFVTDYAPVLEQLQLNSHMSSMIGCEVTPFDYGHHNVFPLIRQDSVNGGAFDWAGGEGASLRLGQMYEGLRQAYSDVVIQMNHPRTTQSGALRAMKIDTATGATHANPADFRQEPHPEATAFDTKLYDNNYDSMEVMNGTGVNTDVLNDWMTFMSRGWLKVGTGASDSHTAYTASGGYGRTWLKVGVDAPSQFTPSAFIQAMKARRALFSSGPFVTLTAQKLDANGQPVGAVFEIGDTVSVGAGESLRLTVDVQAPEWMQFDSVEIHTHVAGREAENGESNSVFIPAQPSLLKTYDPTMLPLEAVPGLNGFTARKVHLHETFTVTPAHDTWLVAMVRASAASRTLIPMAWDKVKCSSDICSATGARAFAVTNAILVDADGSGAYDNFPLKPMQGLRRLPAPPVAGERRVPSTSELKEVLRSVIH